MEMADASCKQPNIVKLVSDFLKFRQLSVKVFCCCLLLNVQR